MFHSADPDDSKAGRITDEYILRPVGILSRRGIRPPALPPSVGDMLARVLERLQPVEL